MELLTFWISQHSSDNNKVPGAKNEIDAVKTEVKTPEYAVNLFSEFGFFVAQHLNCLPAAPQNVWGQPQS